LPKFLALQKLILQKIKQESPDAIILVDFSGFNLRLAKKVNKDEVLVKGEKIADDISTLFEALMPLYEASVAHSK